MAKVGGGGGGGGFLGAPPRYHGEGGGGGGSLMARPPVYNGQGRSGLVRSGMAANVGNRRTGTQSGRHPK